MIYFFELMATTETPPEAKSPKTAVKTFVTDQYRRFTVVDVL